MRILIVEDQPDLALMLAKWLERRGHEAQVSGNAISALTSAPTWLPDVILLDIGLPGMDGWQLAPLLRDAMADKRPLIIAISGFATRADIERSNAAGIAHHLVKPNYFLQLAAILADGNN